MISLFSFEYSREDLKLLFENQIRNVEFENDKRFINQVLERIYNDNIGDSDILKGGQLKYTKDILFKYDPRIIEQFIKLEVTSEDLIWARGQIEKFELKSHHRYPNVHAYRGVAGEKVISRYVQNKFPDIVLNTPIGDGDEIDCYDFKLGNITCDIKCSTQWEHASITPKVDVENNTPKDYYIGGKYDERNPSENFVYIIGYLKHSKMLGYPIKQKHGGRYYEVPLVEMDDFLDLQSIFYENTNMKS